MTQLFTPKQVARAIGSSESSLKRWCDKGLLPTVRTAGGHRRIALDSVVRFLRESQQAVVRPELLGLPSSVGSGQTVVDRAADMLAEALVAGDADRSRRIVLDLYLAGRRVIDICDEVVSPAFQQIGDGWACGDVAVYRERRACQIAMRALFELRSAMPAPAADAPVAIGGALERDPYQLPTITVELALREIGWRADSLGTLLPAETISRAIDELRPRMVWVSVSWIANADDFLTEYASIYATAERAGAAVAVGGRALEPELRGRIRYSVYCDNLGRLVDFARTLAPPAESTASRESTLGDD